MNYRLIWPFEAMSIIALANAVLISVAVIALIIYAVFRQARRLRDWARDRRTAWAVIGVGLLVGVLLIAYFQDGWFRHGIALFVAGFTVFGRTIDPPGLRSLARFERIESLAFDCFEESLPDQLKEFQNLKSLYLNEAKVDDQFIETVNALPSLHHLNLTKSVFAPQFSIAPNRSMDLIIMIDGGKIDLAALSMLGSFQGSLSLNACQLLIPAGERLNMPGTKGLAITQSGMTDAMLLQFVDLPNLAWISLRGDAVTKPGREAFAKERPDVAIEQVW